MGENIWPYSVAPLSFITFGSNLIYIFNKAMFSVLNPAAFTGWTGSCCKRRVNYSHYQWLSTAVCERLSVFVSLCTQYSMCAQVKAIARCYHPAAGSLLCHKRTIKAMAALGMWLDYLFKTVQHRANQHRWYKHTDQFTVMIASRQLI